MEPSRDYVELFATFNAQRVDYLVVGAHALAAHGCVRSTKDLEVWVRPTPENAERTYRALAAFGAPLQSLLPNDLATPGTVFQIGVAPLRIDILTHIDGVEFEEAWCERVATSFGGEPVHALSRPHLERNKRASGRLQDLADLEWLERQKP